VYEVFGFTSQMEAGERGNTYGRLVRVPLTAVFSGMSPIDLIENRVEVGFRHYMLDRTVQYGKAHF
jgi:hypothetical protein